MVTGYLLSLAVWIPASGWIGDRFGTKKIFLFALAMFTLGSALCGLSQNIGELIAFRLLQGIGGGMMTPVGTAMLFRAFPPQRAGQGLGGADHPDRDRAGDRADPRRLAGRPTSAGAGSSTSTCRSASSASLFALMFLREHSEPSGGPLRSPRLRLLRRRPGADPVRALAGAGVRLDARCRVLGTGGAGIALFVALVIVELRVAAADARPAPVRATACSATPTSFCFMAIGQPDRRALPAAAVPAAAARPLGAASPGLATFPQALGMMLIVQLSSRLYPRSDRAG